MAPQANCSGLALAVQLPGVALFCLLLAVFDGLTLFGLEQVLFSAQIAPPCAFTICCDILRPNPEFCPNDSGRSV